MKINCPICGAEYVEGNVSICDICSYPIANDIYLTNLLNYPDPEDLERYNQSLAKYKANWEERRKSEHISQAKIYEEIKEPPASNKNNTCSSTFASQFDNSISQNVNPPVVNLKYNDSSGLHQSPSINSVELVKAIGGTFRMGDDKSGFINEKPSHQVSISTFMISKFPVTQELWSKVMGYNPSTFSEKSDLPVENVSWFDCLLFCNRLSRIEGRESVYIIKNYIDDTGPTELSDNQKQSITADFSKKGYRLPTEAEWEYAARGGGARKDVKYSGTDNSEWAGWFNKKKTYPVGKKIVNPLGLFDMSGNVWEWCWDWFDRYQMTLQKDPKGTVSGKYKIIRGGSWKDDENSMRVSNRGKIEPDVRLDDIGFRVVINL